jgi:mannose-6-phosphate isomerase-like protein (cupin superfamily)
MEKRKLVFKATDVPLWEMPNGLFRDSFQITDATCGPDTKVSAGLVWFAPGNDQGHLDSHDVDEVFYVISGHARYLADGHIYPVEPGDVIYCPAHTEHSFYTDDEMFKLFWLIAGQWSTDLKANKAEAEGEWHQVDAAKGWHIEGEKSA